MRSNYSTALSRKKKPHLFIGKFIITILWDCNLQIVSKNNLGKIVIEKVIIIIITLFMSQVAGRRGSTNWGDRKSNQHKSNQLKCWFLVRGENRSTRRKTSRSRGENQQTQPTYDVRSENRTRATMAEGPCSHHCANTAPLRRGSNYNNAETYFCIKISKNSHCFCNHDPNKREKGRNHTTHTMQVV